MRRLIRVAVALGLAGAMALLTTGPAVAAVPAPACRQEWWFVAWDIQNKVWPVSKGAGVTVAVLDTGVNASLPDLAGVVLPGGDTTGGGTDGRTDTDPAGHGTSMAAFIAAQGRGTGMLGVAPEAKVLPVVVTPSNQPGKAYGAGIRFAVDHGAKVVNLSQGQNGAFISGQCPPELQDAVRYAIDHGAVVVAAAGNERQIGNQPDYPAACAGVLAVGAIDTQLRAWSDTEQQSYVDVAGPGVDTVTINSKGQVALGSGTSGATALVSGAIALVWSKYPKLTNRQVVARILASVRDAGPPGQDELTGTGVVRPSHALLDNIPANAPNPVFDELKTAPSGATTPPPASAQPEPDPSRSDAASSSSDDSDSSSIFPLAYYLVIGLAVVLFAVSMLVRHQRRRPAFGAPAGWSPPPAPNPGQQWPGQPQQWTPPPGQPIPPSPQQWNPPQGQQTPPGQQWTPPPGPPGPPSGQPGHPPTPPESN